MVGVGVGWMVGWGWGMLRKEWGPTAWGVYCHMHADNAQTQRLGGAPLAQKVLHADVFVVEVTFILSTAPLDI